MTDWTPHLDYSDGPARAAPREFPFRMHRTWAEVDAGVEQDPAAISGHRADKPRLAKWLKSSGKAPEDAE